MSSKLASAANSHIARLTIGAGACLLLSAVSLLAQGEQIFKGQVINCVCARSSGQAAGTDKGGDAAPCTFSCANGKTQYALSDTKNKMIYQIDMQRKSKRFLGQYVVILGSLDKSTGTIHVDNMVRAMPPEVFAAKSVFIYCDACPRGMAKAKLAALEAMEGWNRFQVVSDPKNADLIFLFSANPYLGDYITRDGPDKRPVSVDITYMDVVDPQTGESLWGDSRQWGSLLVSKGTKDLISEFRLQLEEEAQSDPQSFPKKQRSRSIPQTATN